MSKSVSKVFRHLSTDDLRHYLAFRRIDCGSIDWRSSDSKIAKTAIALINALPDEQRTVVFTDADAILELSGDAGHRAMLDATQHRADVLEAFDSIDSAEGRALRLFIEDPDAFRYAGWALHCDQSRKGRNWDGFIVPETSKFELSEGSLSAFAHACADAQKARDGFRGAAASESFERLQSWKDEDQSGLVTQVIVYTEDRAQSSMTFEGEALTRLCLRPANELHITYDAADRSIDIVAKGGRSMRKAIAVLFVRHLLGVEAEPDDIVMREIDLSILADRSVLTRSAGGSIETVDLKSVRFSALDGESPTKVYTRRKISIYDDFMHGRLCLPGYEIDRVELNFAFVPEASRARGKCVTVTLTSPNGCSVKDQGQLYRPAIEAFLEHTGIYRGTCDDGDEQIEAAE